MSTGQIPELYATSGFPKKRMGMNISWPLACPISSSYCLLFVVFLTDVRYPVGLNVFDTPIPLSIVSNLSFPGISRASPAVGRSTDFCHDCETQKPGSTVDVQDIHQSVWPSFARSRIINIFFPEPISV